MNPCFRLPPVGLYFFDMLEQDQAELARQLNEAGTQGYAVVSSMVVPGDANNKAKIIVIMKRPKQ